MLAKGKNLHSKTNDFKRLCKESEEKFRQQERSKRCRKEGEPNNADSQLPKKTRSARVSLDEQFTHESYLVKIAPKLSKIHQKLVRLRIWTTCHPLAPEYYHQCLTSP